MNKVGFLEIEQLDGISILIECNIPQDASSVVVMSSGYGIFGIGEPIQDQFSEYLEKSGIGWVKYVYPERRTDAVLDDLTVSSGLNTLHRVIAALELKQTKKIYLFGISFGGVVSSYACEVIGAKGLILANTVIDYADFRRKQLGEVKFQKWQESGWTHIDYPFRSVGLSKRFLQEVHLLKIEGKIKNLALPTLMFQGADDAFIGVNHLESIQAERDDFYPHVVSKCSHAFTEEDAITNFLELVDKHKLNGFFQ